MGMTADNAVGPMPAGGFEDRAISEIGQVANRPVQAVLQRRTQRSVAALPASNPVRVTPAVDSQRRMVGLSSHHAQQPIGIERAVELMAVAHQDSDARGVAMVG